MSKPRVVILGAGPAGLGAAFKLTATGKAQVTVLERNGFVGGNAGSFEFSGVHVDYGSHRLHRASDPEVLDDIRALLGDALKDQQRYGRIRLRGRWIHFPLRPMDLALRLPPSFALGVAVDGVRKVLRARNETGEPESFASVLRDGLGTTICRDFYFPYARKLWGVAPETLSAVQARRRVAAGSLSKMVGKVMAALPGRKRRGAGRFYYPERGFGQISDAYGEASIQAGADIRLSATVNSVETERDGRSVVRYSVDGESHSVAADFVWSTIPITRLARAIKPEAPRELIEASSQIEYRAMILVYLLLDQDRFTEFDAHYFPELDVSISRLSEPKNYSKVSQPLGRTVLCAEIPCSREDLVWKQSDEELGQLVRESLAVAGIPVRAPVLEVVTRRLGQAYPIYPTGYEVYFDRLDRWLGKIDGLLTFGRQGLFAHDNTHHALFMAYSAARCLDDRGRFDRAKWMSYREAFESHVVED